MPNNSPAVNDQNTEPIPPLGDSTKAEKYLHQFIQLIESDRLSIYHTDLSKLDPSSLQDHFRIELQDYAVEISHSKHPSSGKDSYVMLFTYSKRESDVNHEKVILAYMRLTDAQFESFKKVALDKIEERRKAEEERRLKEALDPVDQVLEQISQPVSKSESLTDTSIVSSDLDSPFLEPDTPHHYSTG